MRMFTAASVITAALLCTPVPARADWLLTPFAGVTFGGAAENEHVSFGGSIGYMGAGVIGFEVDFGYTPEFFAADNDELDLVSDSNVTTLMANLLIGAPIGGDNASVRPMSAGRGLLRSNVTDADDFFTVANRLRRERWRRCNGVFQRPCGTSR